MRTSPAHLLAPAALLLAACLPEPDEADLDGPQITLSSLADHAVEVPVAPTWTLELSEPLDPRTVHGGSVALVAWERLDQACALSPVCEEGECVRGRCQAAPLTSAAISAIEDGSFDRADEPAAVALELALAAGPAGPDSRLLIRPRRPLAGHRRHSLILGPALRDRGAAPLVDDDGRPLVWRRRFTTAAGGSSGPEPRLSSPAPGLSGVPTNLREVETRVWPPVPVPQPEAVLVLEADDPAVGVVELIAPRPCPGFVPGTCLRWTVAGLERAAGGFAGERRYRVAGGTLVDRFGRSALRPGPTRETWFATGAGPDQQGPSLAAPPSPVQRGRCLALWVDAGEPVRARLEVGALELEAALVEPGWLGVELVAASLAAGGLAWSLELVDLAGNAVAHDGVLAPDPALASAPALRITELLANPLGPEPDAEFIELRAGPEPVELGGLLISDLSPAALRSAYLADEAIDADVLPAQLLEPGALALIVAAGWAPDLGDDPAPPRDAIVLRVDASLADGGLKNAGEALSVWQEGPAGPLILASYGDWIDTSSSAHAGRSVVGGADACDLPDRWRSHPSGRASPGAWP